jgi:hypothetical protein
MSPRTLGDNNYYQWAVQNEGHKGAGNGRRRGRRGVAGARMGATGIQSERVC